MRADDAGWQRQQARPLDDLLGQLRRYLQDVAGLVLAVPGRVGGELAFVGVELDADFAGQGHLGDGNQQAPIRNVVHGADLGFADQGADEVAGFDLIRQVNRRRGALVLARGVQLIQRLPQMPGLAADQDQQVALRQQRDAGRARQLGTRPTAPMAGVGGMLTPLVSL